MIATAIAVLILGGAVIQIGYCLYFFIRIHSAKALNNGIATHRAEMPMHAQLPVSVIVCAKNEAKNLTENLPSILQQAYHNEAGQPLFEVIVVNDQSTDGTDAILAGFQAAYPHLRIVSIAPDAPRLLPGKKFALGKGLEAASHELILMTDADCKPASKAWISWMAYPFSQGRDIVAGYGGFYARRGFLNQFIRCETVHTYLQYLTYNMAGIPYMAVGRNLACRKALLEKAQQDPLWSQTASGDDDLLIRIGATPGNMVVNHHPASFTHSAACDTWTGWVRQKQRHFSTGKLYHKKVQYLLGGYALSHACFWLGLLAMIILLFVQPGNLPVSYPTIVVPVVLLRLALMWSTWSELSDRVERKGLKFFWPVFDFAWLLYNFIFAPYIFWKNKQQWT